MDARIPAALKVALIFSIIIDVGFGLLLLFVPTLYFEIGGSNLFDPAFLRWAGAPLLAFVLGAYWVLKTPDHQSRVVDMLTIAYVLAALAHIYGFFLNQYSGAIWVIGMPMVSVTVTAILFVVGRRQAAALLA